MKPQMPFVLRLTFVLILLLVVYALLNKPAHADEITSHIEGKLLTTYTTIINELPNATNDEDVQSLVREHLLPIINTTTSAKLALGKHWRKLSLPQKRRFRDALTELQVNTYSTFLLTDTAKTATFDIVRTKTNNKGKSYVTESKFKVNGRMVNVDFKFHHKSGTWKVYDIVVEGISIILSMRASFNDEIMRSGPEELIKKVEAKAYGSVKTTVAYAEVTIR